MKIFKNQNWILKWIKELWFRLEKDMQSLTEQNLNEVFWLDFIASEFQLNNLRIDTLAFDNESQSFVVIEYKMRWQNLDIAQWLAYLSLLLNNKAEFVQKLSILRNKVIKNVDIDWTQSKVIFISESFTEHQKESINFKDLPISLCEMRQLQTWEIIFNDIKARIKTESIKTITKSKDEYSNIEKEIVTYDENYHISWKSDEIIELYEKIKQFIHSLDPNFEIIYRKMYVAFRINKKNIVSIHLFVNSLNVWLYWKYGTINDEYWLIRDVSWVWNYGSAENEIKIDTDKNLIRVFELINQAYSNQQ